MSSDDWYLNEIINMDQMAGFILINRLSVEGTKTWLRFSRLTSRDTYKTAAQSRGRFNSLWTELDRNKQLECSDRSMKQTNQMFDVFSANVTMAHLRVSVQGTR